MSQIKTAMVLAAGLGTRMRPLTDERPKALVTVAGRPLIDHVLDRLVAAGIETAVVNVHHFADQMEAHLAGRRDMKILISDERAALLDSGGGIKHARHLLGDDPILIANIDSLWIEGQTPALETLKAAWDPDAMDLCLLLVRRGHGIGFEQTVVRFHRAQHEVTARLFHEMTFGGGLLPRRQRPEIEIARSPVGQQHASCRVLLLAGIKDRPGNVLHPAFMPTVADTETERRPEFLPCLLRRRHGFGMTRPRQFHFGMSRPRKLHDHPGIHKHRSTPARARQHQHHPQQQQQRNSHAQANRLVQGFRTTA